MVSVCYFDMTTANKQSPRILIMFYHYENYQLGRHHDSFRTAYFCEKCKKRKHTRKVLLITNRFTVSGILNNIIHLTQDCYLKF